MIEEYDVIVIGSGAGGAPIAYELVQLGKSVLVLEKGPLMRSQYQTQDGLSDFKRDELFATGPEKRVMIEGVANKGQAFYTSHIEPDLNDEPHVYLDKNGEDQVTIEGYTAQAVGGGTNLFGAVSLRFSELDFKLQSFNATRPNIPDDVKREARDWPFSYATLEPYYAKAERLVGINGTVAGQGKSFSSGNHYQKPLAPNPISQHALDGMLKRGFTAYRTPLAVITEDHAPSGRKAGQPKTGYVNRYGDPMGFKSSTWVSLLYPISKKSNFTLRPNSVVTHLQTQGGRVDVVHYRDPSGDQKQARGKLIVVACSAIESVRLLMLSAEEEANFARRIRKSGLLGSYFLTHCFGGADGIVPKGHDKSVSLDSDWATDACAERSFLDSKGLWAGSAIYNNTSDQALPVSLARTHGSQDLDTIWKAFDDDVSMTGPKLVEWIKRNFGKRLSVSFMANQVPVRSNRIELHPRVLDKWKRKVGYVIKDWHDHDKHLMNVMAEECRQILLAGGLEVDSVEYGGIYQAENARARIANHILGGARFGKDSSDSVLDPHCRAWEFDNLYVTDGSFMPTSGGGNPTLTILANSFRVADELARRV